MLFIAITKIHPIKFTLKKAIDYICSSEKTDGELLVSSYKCSPETADLEFKETAKNAMNKGDNLAHHIIQSFALEDDITSEKAHRLGKELAEKVLGGKYEYVLTTHIDKGHVHNHIIFNAVDMEENKKYISNEKTYHKIRNISDKICFNNNLSVPKPIDKGKSYKEWLEYKAGNSYKAKLKNTIDKLIVLSSSYDEFLSEMQKLGYEIKRGKHISFRVSGQKRFTRGKTLGFNYSEYNIKSRIYTSNKNKEMINDDSDNSIINKLINMDTDKVKSNKGFEHWAKIHNLKESANTLLAMQQKNLDDYTALDNEIKNLSGEILDIGSEIKEIESKISELDKTFDVIDNYVKTKPVYTEYKSKNSILKKEFYKKNKLKINRFYSASKELKKLEIVNDDDVKNLKHEYSNYQKKLDNLYSKYYNSKEEYNKLYTAKKNIDSVLNKDNIKTKNDIEI